MKIKICIATILILSTLGKNTLCQNLKGYEIIKLIPTTEVKDQGNSGTCWSFGTISFLETEILRKKNLSIDLSEMFVVRHIYPEKAKNFFRTQGNSFLTAGGQPHDVLNVVKKIGIVPETAYPQKMDKTYGYNTSELDTSVCQFVFGYRINEEEIISLDWTKEFDELLDQYLGTPPLTFNYGAQTFTPQTFSSEILELDMNDYINITSYNHHPYNENFCLESRFNWSLEPYYNVELDTFMSIIKRSIMNGYSVVFNGDVSENGFDFYKGTAKVSVGKKDEVSYRQSLFESGSTTVDHVMHIVGLAEGKDGKSYFITKNSWGAVNSCSGYIYLSEDYVKFKTVSILVNKEILEL